LWLIFEATARTGSTAKAANGPRGEHDDFLPVVSNDTSNSLVQYLSSQRMVHCPSFADYFKGDTALELEARGYGYIIGYNYHGGHANTPWPSLSGRGVLCISPQRFTYQSSLVLISDILPPLPFPDLRISFWKGWFCGVPSSSVRRALNSVSASTGASETFGYCNQWRSNGNQRFPLMILSASPSFC